VSSLEDLVVELRAVIAAQAVVIAELRAQVVALQSEVADLKARLGKDSGNSSVPPSRDPVDRRVRRAAEREARKVARDGVDGVTRRPGKQPGTPGATLQRRVADGVVEYRPDACSGCGDRLDTAVVTGRSTRQVIEVPVPKAVTTDHVVLRCRCHCGHQTVGVFPTEATGPTCWGPRAKAIAAYLMARQHIPLERCAEAMAVLFDAPIGEGTLAGLIPDAAARLDPFLTEIGRQLQVSGVVHVDETSIRVGTKLNWIHTISTELLTLLSCRPTRGMVELIDIGVLTDYTGVIVHDGLGLYNRPELAAATHAQCGAHLLRHLIDAGTVWKYAPWTTSMRGVLLDAKRASEQAAAAGLTSVPVEIAGPIMVRYSQTLVDAFTACRVGPPPRLKNTGGWTHADRANWNLACRFRDQQPQILRMLENTAVRFDNNEAERSLRMAKLHDKIAGAFRSPDHARAFCTVRSYIQTGRKHAIDTLDNLTRLWTTSPWLPPNVS
jgi:transposase